MLSKQVPVKFNLEVYFGSGQVLSLTNILYSSKIADNLISIRELTECKHELHFDGTNILDKCDTDVIFSSFINRNLYVLSEFVSMPLLLNNDVVSESMKWHKRLGHIGQIGFTVSQK